MILRSNRNLLQCPEGGFKLQKRGENGERIWKAVHLSWIGVSRFGMLIFLWQTRRKDLYQMSRFAHCRGDASHGGRRCEDASALPSIGLDGKMLLRVIIVRKSRYKMFLFSCIAKIQSLRVLEHVVELSQCTVVLRDRVTPLRDEPVSALLGCFSDLEIIVHFYGPQVALSHHGRRASFPLVRMAHCGL